MTKAFTFRFDTKPLDDQATKLDRALERGRLALRAVDVVNAVTTRADETLRRGEIQDINLTPAYVRSKTDVQLASLGSKPRATITTKGDLTILGNFNPQTIRSPGAIRKAGPVKGNRSAGVAVAIKRSVNQGERQWFLMRLRRGTEAGNKFGVFVRDPSLKPNPKGLREGKHGKRHIYGPSPYSLFRAQIGVQYDDISDDLARTVLAELGDALQESLK